MGRKIKKQNLKDMVLTPPEDNKGREIGFFVLGLMFGIFGNILSNGLWELAGEQALTFNQINELAYP